MENPKEEFCDNCNNEICCCIVKKQETLEEAYNRIFDNKLDRVLKAGFIQGSKWQQKKSYSEEEVYFIIRMVSGMKDSDKSTIEIEEYFKQFKKK